MRRILLLVALLTGLLTVAVPAAQAADDGPPHSLPIVSPGCRDLDLRFPASDSLSYNEGVPWLLEAGPEIDLTASWLRARTFAPADQSWVGLVDHSLYRGSNQLRVHAADAGHTRLTWRLERTDGKPACEGEADYYVRHLATPAGPTDQDYRRGHSILRITGPAQGAELEVGKPVTITFDCAYTGPLPTESDCLGPNGDAGYGYGAGHSETFVPEHLGQSSVCVYGSVDAQGNPPESTYGWFNGVDCLWYHGVPAVVKPPLETEVRLETKTYPSTEWTPVADGASLVAGNPVRVVTTLRNVSEEDQDVDLAVRDVATDTVVPGSEESFEMPPGAEYERATRWDTTDRAWLAPHTPAVRPSEVAVEIGVGREKRTLRRSLQVTPRPLVLVHGWKSYAESSWGKYQEILDQAHPSLRGYAVGDGRFPGRMNTNGGGTGCQTCRTNTVAENAAEEARYIEALRKATGAWHVDVLAHSMGGLISRYYLQELMPLDADGAPVVHRLIQMGTPNRGSQLADMMMAFGAAGQDKIPFYPASLHLTPGWVEGYFNQLVTDTRGVPVSNLVGTQIPLVGMPLLPWLAGDGIVPADSARWTLTDTMDSPLDFHTAMTESADDFTKYVLPRLSTPVTRAERRTAMAEDDTSDDDPVIFEQRSQPNGVRTVALAAHGTAEVPFTLEAATTLGALTADGRVRLTLLDAAGEVIAGSGDDTASGAGMTQVSTYFHQARGTGTLRVKDLAGKARSVDVLTFVAGSALTLEAADSPWTLASPEAGQVTARLVRNDSTPVTGTVTARVMGRSGETTLLDDGEHGDGPAGDGVYGARLGDLPAGPHPVVVTARTTAGSVRIAGTVIEGNGRGAEEPRDPGDPGDPKDPGGQGGPKEPTGPGSVTPDRPSAGTALLSRFETVVRQRHVRPAVARQLRGTLRSVVRLDEAGSPRAAQQARRLRRQITAAQRGHRLTRAQQRALMAVWRTARDLAATP